MANGMTTNILAWTLGLALLPCVAAAHDTPQPAAQPLAQGPVPCVIALADTTSHYQPLLTGAPQTTSMEAGLVILAPGKSGSLHSSKGYEETLVVLAGQGVMDIVGGAPLTLRAGAIAYCPVRTEHQIRNIGAEPLKYVYVAAKAIP